MTQTFITGINGFTGQHLAYHLTQHGEQVAGLSPIKVNLPYSLYVGDIRDQSLLRQALTETEPEVIYHLAALIKATDVADFYQVNVLGTVALFDTLLETGSKAKVIVTSSSAVYGRGVGAGMITEGFQLRPITHYGVSKVAQEAVSFRYYHSHGLPVMCTRAFNLLGPAQPPTLACSGFAQQIAQDEGLPNQRQIVVRNLSSQRDFTDVRDAVRAYRLIAQYGQPGEAYNICSQRAVSIRKTLDLLLGLAHQPFEVITQESDIRVDVPIQVGSAKKIQQQTGWQPDISLEQSLADLLAYWRRELQAG